MKKISTFIVLAALAATYSSASGATDYFVRGVAAADSTGSPESFATLRIYEFPDTAKMLIAAVTGEDGKFEQKLPKEGHYLLRLSSMGMKVRTRDFTVTPEQPVANLDTIVFGTDNMLQELEVTAQRPLISREIDRIGYDVAGDPESKTSQLDEILKKVPLVSVDPDGTIKVKGSSNFVVYKNGRKNTSFTNNAKDIFKSIPASMIKKIEVITDPGAREDAEGSTTILNIVTEQNMVIKGVTGNVGLNYNSNNDVPNPSLWLTTQVDKVTVEANGGLFVSSRRSSKGHSETDRTFEGSDNRSLDISDSENSNTSGYGSFSLSYEPDTLNLVTGEFFFWMNRTSSDSWGSYTMFDRDNSLLYSYDSKTHTSPARNHFLDGTFNYQRLTRKKGEKFIFTYMISGNGNSSKSETNYLNAINMPVSYSGIFSDNNAVLTEHTLQADWERPLFKGHTFDLGAKYVYRDNHSKNNQRYLGIDRDDDTDFSHITQIAAVFADYRVNIGRLGLRGGVRYEYSRLAAKYKLGDNDDFHSNLNDVVPNAAISYNLNDANSLKLSYSASIRRPGINYLNPALITNPQSESQGNPDLSSTRNHSLNFNYSLFSRMVSIDFNAGYSFSNNEIIQIQELLPGDRIRSTYANAGKNGNFSTSAWVQWTVHPKTRLMLNAFLDYTHVENPSLKLKMSGWTPMFMANVNQQLPWKLTATIYANYWGNWKSLYSVSQSTGISKFGHGIHLRKSFLKENRLTAAIGVSNPFGNGRRTRRSYVINMPYTSVTNSYNTGYRSVNISISYRFGNLNAQVKKVRGVKSDDVVGGNSRES